MSNADEALTQLSKTVRDFSATGGLEELKSIAPDLVLRAKLIAAHFLLPDDALILDIGCENGGLTEAIAKLCPRHRFIGVDRNKQVVERASKKYEHIENLSFQVASADSLPFADSSLDGIVNSRILGDVYSQSGYREDAVRDALRDQFRALRPEGMMIIYDYAKAPDDEFMLLEFPTLQRGNKITGQPFKKTKGDRDAEDLIWFAENARPKQARGCEGFFLEELSPRFPYTRLFRLPAKWAFEFIIRKENMDDIKAHIAREHAVFTDMDYFRELQSLGGRVLYSTPWQNPHTLKARFIDNFRLYRDDGTNAGFPATGKLVTIQKMQNRKSLMLHELRSTKKEAEHLQVQTVRDEKTGALIDVVERKEPTADFIPYSINPDGRIKIYLHFAAPKCVSNTVPRLGTNIDGKRWSGHIISPLKMPISKLDNLLDGSRGELARTMMKETGLKPSVSADIEEGPKGYPSPDMISEMLRTYFVEVQSGQTPKCMAKLFEDRKGFSTVGEIRELDAQDVLRAINVGFIPNGWLEIQISDLLRRHDVEPQSWMGLDLPIANEMPPADKILRADDILAQIEDKSDDDESDSEEGSEANSGKALWAKDERFKRVKGSAGKMRTVRSLFIDEGMVDGRMEGLASSDAEFAIAEGETVNKAVIMPLARSFSGNVMMGFELEELPVPSRFGQTGKMINLPSMTLPREIKTIDEAKAHIAEIFETTPEYVTQMGEGFFTNVDVTPQRIFYFAVGAAAGGGVFDTFYAPIQDLWMLTKPDFAWSFLYIWGFQSLVSNDQNVFYNEHNPRLEEKARLTANNAPRHSMAFTSSAEKGAHAAQSDKVLMGSGKSFTNEANDDGGNKTSPSHEKRPKYE
jgi:SAM-dependent methyltransferase